MNILFTLEDSKLASEVTLDDLAHLIHPLAAVYWDRDFPLFGGDLEVSHTTGYAMRVILARNGTAYAFTGDHTDYLAVWNFVDLRWMPGDEVRKWLEKRKRDEAKVTDYLDHNWERTRRR